MSELKKLYATGAEILSAARRRFLPLEPGDGNLNLLEEGGWDPSKDGGFPTASRLDEATQSYAFYAQREFAASPLRLCCLIREFDLGKLAGQLQMFNVKERSVSMDRVEYVSVLPWPFEPRWIQATLKCGVDRESGALVILGESVPGAPAPSGYTAGTVHYSFYHILPGEMPDTSVLRRVINVDLHLPLPAFVIRKSLASHYVTDMEFIDQELAAWEGSALEKRMQMHECYRALEQAAAPQRVDAC